MILTWYGIGLVFSIPSILIWTPLSGGSLCPIRLSHILQILGLALIGPVALIVFAFGLIIGGINLVYLASRTNFLQKPIWDPCYTWWKFKHRNLGKKSK